MQYVHIELLTLTWIEPRINGLGLQGPGLQALKFKVNSREEISGLYL